MNLMGNSSPGVQPARGNVKGREPQSCLCVEFIALLMLNKGYVYRYMLSLGEIQMTLSNNNIFICIILIDALPGDKHEFKSKAIISYKLLETMLPSS